MDDQNDRLESIVRLANEISDSNRHEGGFRLMSACIIVCASMAVASRMSKEDLMSGVSNCYDDMLRNSMNGTLQ
jgi:hypothetical protein